MPIHKEVPALLMLNLYGLYEYIRHGQNHRCYHYGRVLTKISITFYSGSITVYLSFELLEMELILETELFHTNLWLNI